MKRVQGFTILVIWIFASGCGTKKSEVNGEFAVVTRSGENIKLGLTSVYALNDRQYKAAFDTSEPATRRRIDSMVVADSIWDANNYMTLSSLYAKIANTWEGLARKATMKYDRFRIASLKKRADRCLRQAEENRELARVYASKALTHADSARRACFISVKQSQLREFVNSTPEVISGASDADGKFRLALPETGHHVVAFASRMVGDSTEEYFWDFPYTPGARTLKLNNDNLAK